MKKHKPSRRMSDSDISAIVCDLDRWAAGQLGTGLTWGVLEGRFGFTRQAMERKPEIKSAFQNAKLALAGGLVKTRDQAVKESEALQLELIRLRRELADHQRRERLWQARWQRIAFHIRQRGVRMQLIDCDVPPGADPPSEQEVREILRPFDKAIPPTGRV